MERKIKGIMLLMSTMSIKEVVIFLGTVKIKLFSGFWAYHVTHNSKNNGGKECEIRNLENMTSSLAVDNFRETASLM